MRHLVRPTITTLLLVIASTWLAFELSPPVRNIAIDPAAIRHDTGKSYTFVVPPVGIPELLSPQPDPGTNSTSVARLYEDGTELGPAHSVHNTIRKSGGGRFSYWYSTLYFSSSDGTSPITNGHQYTLRLELTPSPLFSLLGILALALLVRTVINLMPRRLWGKVNAGLETVIYPTDRSWGTIVSVILFIISAVGAVAFLVHAWKTGHTTNGFGIGDLFQISDSSDYADCAKRILDRSVIPGPIAERVGDWCSRRTIYPSFLATIMAVSGRDWIWTLLIQCFLVGMSIGIAAITVNWIFGTVSAAATAWYLFAFAQTQVFGTTMTENAGLLFGALGTAILIDGTHRESFRLQCFGTALLSVALNARAGAFFVLPILVFWEFSIAKGPTVTRLSRASAIALSATVGFLVQLFLVHAYGAPTGSSQSNFAYTLYGLSVGGMGWSQIYTDHPELFHHGLSDSQISRAIFQFARQNILQSPADFLKGLATNIRQYLADPMFGLQYTEWFDIKGAPWWLSMIALAFRWRDPVCRLIILASIGIVLSAAFIRTDGGLRAFAATWPFVAAQIGLGVVILIRAFARIFLDLRNITFARNCPANFFSIGTSGILMAAVLVPVIVPQYWLAAKVRRTFGCPVGEKEMVTRLGKESYMIALLPRNSVTDFWKSEENDQNLKNGYTGSWVWKGFMSVTPPVTIIRGYQLANTNDIPYGTMVPVYIARNVGPLSGKTVSICVGPDKTKTFADVDFSRIHSVRVISDPEGHH